VAVVLPLVALPPAVLLPRLPRRRRRRRVCISAHCTFTKLY